MQIVARYIVVFNIALLAGFAYLLADLVNLMVGQKFEINPVLPPVESLVSTSGQVSPTKETYKVILDRNIFTSQPVSRIASQEPVAPVQRLPLQIQLVGTVAGASEDSFAIIRDQATKEEHLYRLGDSVGSDGKLIEIRRNQVVLLREGGLKETIEVIWTEKTNRPGKSPPRAAKSGSAPSGQTHWALDRQEVDEALQNLPQLLTQARVIPHISSDGQNQGFRIVSIKPGSFYQKIGLKNGDVIQQINGIEVKDPQTFMSVFNQLRNEKSVTLDLIRRNKKETFSYEVR